MAQVSDYNIANASGASVRSDLNAVFSAIKTLNSGGSDPSNPEAFMPYVDTADNNNLKIRNSANNGFTTIGPVNTANLGLLPRAGGVMTGILGLPNQTAANPSLHFGDTTTGFFRAGSNKIGVAADGTEQLFMDQNGIRLNSQNQIRFGDANSSHYAAIKAPTTITTSYTLTLPLNDGNSGQFLKTDGSGGLSFATITTFSGAASALTGNTLASVVKNSSLTSVGTLGSLTVSGNISANGNINGDGNTNISSINTLTATNANTTTTKATRFRSNNSSTPVFQNSSGSETAAGRLVRAFCHFDSYRGGAANDNYASIRRSFNVSSVTDHSEGVFTINFSTNLPNRSTTTTAIDYHRFTFGNHCQCYLDSENGANAGNVKIRIIASTNSSGVLDKSSVNVINT